MQKMQMQKADAVSDAESADAGSSCSNEVSTGIKL